jgi:hypothetical protein
MRSRSSELPRLEARVLKAVLGLIEAAWWRCAAAAAGRKRCYPRAAIRAKQDAPARERYPPPREKIPGSGFMPYSPGRADQLVGLIGSPASGRILGHRHACAVAPQIRYSLH